MILTISCLFYLAQPTKFMTTNGFLPTVWKSLVYLFIYFLIFLKITGLLNNTYYIKISKALIL